jgi:hypothetical protein
MTMLSLRMTMLSLRMTIGAVFYKTGFFNRSQTVFFPLFLHTFRLKEKFELGQEKGKLTEKW